MPKLLHQRFRGVAVGKRRSDAQSAADADQRPPLVVKFIALGVAAKIVVVVQDENALVGSQGGAVEMRGRESGDAAAYDHQVVFFANLAVGHRKLRVLTAADVIELGDRGGIVAAQSGACRRIVAGLLGGLRLRVGGVQSGGDTGDSDRNAIQEIAACDRPVHAKVTMLFGSAHIPASTAFSSSLHERSKELGTPGQISRRSSSFDVLVGDRKRLIHDRDGEVNIAFFDDQRRRDYEMAQPG